MITEFDRQLISDPESITDEKVVISDPVPDNTGYYQGYILGLVNSQITGNTSTQYGIYSLAAKAGTRYEVIEGALPANAQILIDRTTGRLIANQQITVYVTYPWYARIFHWWETGVKEIQLPNTYINTDSLTIYEETLQYPTGFVGIDISVPSITRGAGDAIFALRKNAVATNLATITLTAGQYTATAAFASRVCFSAGDKLVLVAVTAAGIGVMSPCFNLRRG
jgi:hypothetical protein